VIADTTSTWQEMARLEELAAQRGNDVSALLVGVEELQRYRAAIRAVRLERDQLRAQLYGRFGKTA
jgi:hypothetical protein